MDNIEKLNALVGKTLDNRYKVLEVVGIGGMAVVLKAEDTVMNRVVAIKVLNDEYNGDENAVRRFVNESKAVAMLSHPNIVNIFDVAFGSTMKYIVMEYIDGIALNDYMQKKGKLTWKDAVHFADQILLALEHAHEKGIVHRDVKPQNIMLLRSGTVKVADFGIAKLPNIENNKSVQEKAIGTVYYMSPEQACGQPTDTATDIYSLGVMLYEMTTGELPFDGETTTEIAEKQVNELPKEPRSIEITIPRGLEQIILKAMEKDPKDRYDSAHTMRRMLQILRNNPSIVFADGNNSRTNTATAHAGENNIDHDTNTRQFDAVTTGSKIPISNNPVNANETANQKTIQQQPIRRPVPKAVSQNKKAVTGDSEVKTVSKKRPVKKAKSTMFPIILGVVMAFLVVLVVGGVVLLTSVLDNSTGVGTVYEIPNYIGLEYNDELKNRIIADGLDLKYVKYDTSDKEDTKNLVIEQTPAPDSKTKTADLVLTVSLGNQTKIMPDLVMSTYTQAEIYLKNMNMSLEPVVEYISDAAILENYIIKTEPSAGEMIKAGEQIKLYVSSGDNIKYSSVPNLVGMTEQEARRALVENGITKMNVTSRKSGQPDGEVLEQDIPEGNRVPSANAVINVVISEYDKSLDPNAPPEDLPVSGTVDDPNGEPLEGDDTQEDLENQEKTEENTPVEPKEPDTGETTAPEDQKDSGEQDTSEGTQTEADTTVDDVETQPEATQPEIQQPEQTDEVEAQEPTASEIQPEAAPDTAVTDTDTTVESEA